MRIIDTGSAGLTAFLEAIEANRHASLMAAGSIAASAIDQVRKSGDEAVAGFVRQFDDVPCLAADLRTVPSMPEIGPDIRRSIELAMTNIRRVHERQVSAGYSFENDGIRIRHRVSPLTRVGIYVPGGSAAYISTLMMCAIPARIAGVVEIVVASTPMAADMPEFQYVCSRLGVSEIYRAGGPAAIAAMALGTRSLRRVDKIVGPGSGLVTAAKRLLYGEVGLDMTAGPSEIVILADDSANPAWVAADLLAQAEHGADSVPVCVTTSPDLAGKISAQVREQLARFAGSPSGAAGQSIERNGAILIAPDLETAIALVNRIAPEHVEIIALDAERIADAIPDCGAIFCGSHSAVALGDYAAGTNHVLPTAGSARFFSPLGVYDFVKRTSIVTVTEPGFVGVAEAVERLAELEGLPLHARSVALRRSAVPAEVVS